MAPKKKGGEETAKAAGPTAFNEVEKALLDLQIADLNRKLARFRQTVNDYELRNEELQNAYDKLDEDRADIIAYLKRCLNLKNEENNELKDRVKGLEELREEENKRFKEQVQELERNFTTMKAQLTSENKLLAGKINTLEEFRAIRDDLMKKFERQEQAFEDQEMKYKRIIYDAEKKIVIGKDKLKREMEARLLNLAQDFQDASESRIAASTHRVIRENIALNNQLDNLLFTQSKVAEQNEKLKESQLAARTALEVAEAERDKAINKSVVQLKAIDQLTMAYRNVQKTQALNQSKLQNFEHLEAKVNKLTKDNENMSLQIRILEQNLHSSMGEQNKYLVISAKLTRERDKYKKVLKEVTSAIQAAMKMDQWAALDPAREVQERKIVLKNILSVIRRQMFAVQAESVESLVSFTDIYEKGDLGFVPKAPTEFGKPSKLSLTASEAHIASKSSSSSAIPSVASILSLKTVPSLQIIPKGDEVSVSSKESIPSFTVTSLHSTPMSSKAESVDSFEALTDVEKQLALSKLEIQKSILKDLAASQTQSRLMDARSSADLGGEGGKSKTMISSTDLKEGEGEPKVEGEEGKTGTDEQKEVTEEEALAESAAGEEQEKEAAAEE